MWLSLEYYVCFIRESLMERYLSTIHLAYIIRVHMFVYKVNGQV